MVHFDFIVSDEEAQTIFECITDSIQGIQEDLSRHDPSHPNALWFKEHIAYLKGLAAKMKNTKVSDET